MLLDHDPCNWCAAMQPDDTPPARQGTHSILIARLPHLLILEVVRPLGECFETAQVMLSRHEMFTMCPSSILHSLHP